MIIGKPLYTVLNIWKIPLIFPPIFGLYYIWRGGARPEALSAVQGVLSFPATYLCEAGFSACTSTKTIYHNRSNAEVDMRCHSPFKLYIKETYKTVKHISH